GVPPGHLEGLPECLPATWRASRSASRPPGGPPGVLGRFLQGLPGWQSGSCEAPFRLSSCSMTPILRSNDPDLRDLAQGRPALANADAGGPSGLRLVKWLGAGGMSAVFLAERDPGVASPHLSDITPMLVAVKIVKPETEHGLAQRGMSST